MGHAHGEQRCAHADGAARATSTATSTVSAPVTVNVANASYFQNEILATGFNLPTAIKFLPDGRMLVVELAGTIRVLPPPYTTPDPTPFLQLTNIGSAGVQQGIYDIALDPNFATNHYYYIFYTLGTPNRDRCSRFTANATLTGTIPGSEFVIYQDPQNCQCRAPRRRDQLRQRRKDLRHDRRAFQRRRGAGSHQAARQDPALQHGRHRTDRQPVL